MALFVESENGKIKIPVDLYGKFGTGTFFPQEEFLSFEESKKVVRNLNIKSSNEWRDYRRSGEKPNNVPSNLSETYKDKGWINWGDFLGTNK